MTFDTLTLETEVIYNLLLSILKENVVMGSDRMFRPLQGQKVPPKSHMRSR